MQLERTGVPLQTVVMDEIALEGLEGVTLPSLWIYLSRCLKLQKVPRKLKNQIWRYIKACKRNLAFYMLPEERADVVIYDRFSVTDPEKEKYTRYKFTPTQDEEARIFGSCEFFKERKKIHYKDIKNLSLDAVMQIWGRKFVIVANQKLRWNALTSPNVIRPDELTSTQYAILEVIGRSRTNGETTVGHISLVQFVADSSILFYIKNKLLSVGLIYQQPYHEKMNDRLCPCSLVFLPRFFKPHKTPMMKGIENLAMIVKNEPNFQLSTAEARKRLPLEQSRHLKKLSTIPQFRDVFDIQNMGHEEKKENEEKKSDERVSVNIILRNTSVRRQEVFEMEYDTDEEFSEQKFRNLKVSRVLYKYLEKKKKKAEQETQNGNNHMERLDKEQTAEKDPTVVEANKKYPKDSHSFAKKVTDIFSTIDNGNYQKNTEEYNLIEERIRQTNERIATNEPDPPQETQPQVIDEEEQQDEPETKAVVKKGKVKRKRKKEKTKCIIEISSSDSEDDLVIKPPGEEDDDEAEWTDIYVSNDHSYVDMPISEQFVNCVRQFGSHGISINEIGKYIGINHLTVRQIAKNLQDTGIVKTYNVDLGRQKTNMFVTADNVEEVEKLKARLQEMQNLKCDDEPNIPKVSDELMNDVDFIHGVIKANVVNMENQSKEVFTQRLIKRKELVIQSINSNCILQVSDLRSFIKTEEEKMGYTDEACLKSIWRVLHNLSHNRIINLYDITLKYKDVVRLYRYLTHPKIGSDHPILKHEMVKLKNALYLIFEEKKPAEKLAASINSISNNKNLKEQNEKQNYPENRREENRKRNNLEAEQGEEIDQGKGKDNDKSTKKTVPARPLKFPKLLVARHMHELFHYLAYELENDANPVDLTEDLLLEWQHSAPNLQVKQYLAEWQDAEDKPQIYRKHLGWKTFVPPVPAYEDKPSGWLYFMDVMKRIPLSILNKIFRIEKEATEMLLDFINHPVKQHYLLRQLPTALQGIVVTRLDMQKTYLTTIKLLQHMGLLQVAPRATVRDPLVIWIFINRNARILDTTASDPGYDCVNEEIEYEEKRYVFNSSLDVTAYWNDLHRICAYTKLGFKRVKRKETRPRAKELNYLPPTKYEEAPSLDKGTVPGDGLGAAGLSSFLYSHNLRHWSWIIQANIQPSKPVRPARLPTIRSKPKISLNARRPRIHMPPLKSKTKTMSSVSSMKTVHAISAKKSGPRDAIDRDALNNMSSLRVRWYPREDDLLKMARAVYIYIAAPVPALGLLAVGKIVRDLLRHCMNIKNKTSQACVRRGQFLVKMHRDVPEVPSWLHILQTNPYIQNKYGEDFLKRLKLEYPNRKEYCDALIIHFIQILKILYKIVYENDSPWHENQMLNFTLPDTIKEFKKRFNERLPLTDDPIVLHKNPQTEHDQHVSVVHSVLHSCLCCIRDKTLYNLQAFEIYKTYSEEVLQDAFRKAHNDGLAIAIKRKNLQLSSTQLSGPAYLLSSKYRMRLVFLKLPYCIYDSFYAFYIKSMKDFFGAHSSKSKDYFELKSPQIGQLILIAEGLSRNFLLPFIKFPVNILTLDAEYKEKCTHIDRIMDHYSSIFDNAPKTEYSKYIETDVNERESLVKFHPAFITFNVKYNPYDIISKLADYNLHFFCALCNLQKTVTIDLSKLQHKDEETQVIVIDCPFENCVMKAIQPQSYMSIIDRVVHLRRNTLENIKKDTTSNIPLTLSVEPLTITINQHNLLPLVRALENHWQNTQLLVTRKDFGNLNVATRREPTIDWPQLCQEIINFKKSDQNSEIGDDYEVKSSKDKVIRTQDIFVVNLPTLQFKVNSKMFDTNKKTINFHGVNVPEDLAPLESKREEILQRIRQESFWKYTENTLDTLKQEEYFMSLSFEEKILVHEVHDYIETERLGVPVEKLLEEFHDIAALSKVLNVLSSHYLVKRVGVATFMYVHRKYVRPWVIHTFHMTRLEKEKLGSTVSVPSKRKGIENLNESVEKEDVLEVGTKKIKLDENIDGEPLEKRRRQKPLKFDEMQDREAQLKQKTQQRSTIVMKPRPWLRLNASLNRRVLDRWLGSILTECIARSGCFLTELSQRFPQVLPVDIYYLVEILTYIDCVHLTQIEPAQIDLFSSYESIQERRVTDVYDPSRTYVTTHADAISRMALFIGQKKYDAEFV